MQRTSGLLVLLGLFLAPAVNAEPSTKVQVEVNFLLGYVDGAGCAFNRNGIWYDAKAAQTHLRTKYNYLVARNLIASTEDFIERGATASSLSGQPYEVRCNSGPTVTSRQWLLDELARFRMF